MNYFLAIDIGASSGRHILGHVEDGKIVLEEMYRFDNSQIRKDGHDCWDMAALSRAVIAGLKACKDAGKVPSTIGIDTWGVDFVLLDEQGLPCSDMVAYRDARTEGADALVDAAISADELYARCGIQKMLFNTIYQLAALKKEHPEQIEKAQRMLMVPEYLNFVLTGKMANEYTNATTGNLVNARSKDWDWEVIDKLGLPRRIFGKLEMPGTPWASTRRSSCPPRTTPEARSSPFPRATTRPSTSPAARGRSSAWRTPSRSPRPRRRPRTSRTRAARGTASASSRTSWASG